MNIIIGTKLMYWNGRKDIICWADAGKKDIGRILPPKKLVNILLNFLIPALFTNQKEDMPVTEESKKLSVKANITEITDKGRKAKESLIFKKTNPTAIRGIPSVNKEKRRWPIFTKNLYKR
jgi:hypothetical protein